MASRILSTEFYRRPTEIVAEELLGKLLVHQVDATTRMAGIITETEAYLGTNDPACHTFRGRRTSRVASMYLLGGHAYVYFIYGMYFCFNVVTAHHEPEAVLIRALIPTEGVDLIARNRKQRDRVSLRSGQKLTRLLNGPGKLCQGMGINLTHNGCSLTEQELYIEESSLAPLKEAIVTLPRVGVGYAGDAAFWPLRFQWCPPV